MAAKMNGLSDNFDEVQIPVPWGHITGKWWGPRDCQPVIAIHGWQDNAGTFDNLVPLLIKNGDVSIYCIDLPGHGLSSHIPPGLKYYVYWDGIHYLRRIVKYFNWKNITVIGHSLGGIIAFLYAAAYPNDIKKYVSIDNASPSVKDPKEMVDILGYAVDKFLKYENMNMDEMIYSDYEEMLDIILRAHGGSVNEEGCKILLKRGMKPSARNNGYVFTRDPRLKVSALGFITIDQTMELASRIKCDVLNIKATQCSNISSKQYYDLVLDTIEKQANVERYEFEGTHHLHLNDAESIAPTIYRFLIAPSYNRFDFVEM